MNASTLPPPATSTAGRALPPVARPARRSLLRFVLWSPTSVILQAKILRGLTALFSRPNPAGARANRIVLVKLDLIGDFVLLTPFLRELRRHRPAAWITLVTSTAARPLAEHCPWVDAVVVAPRANNRRFGALGHWLDWLALAWRHLQPLRPTLALLPRWDLDIYDAYPLLRLSGARSRISYSVDVDPIKFARSPHGDRFLTTAYSHSTGGHEVERNLYLLQQLGMAAEPVEAEVWPAADPQEVLRRLKLGPGIRFLVALCPFSTDRARDWPLERFLAVATQFADRPSVHFLLIAGPDAAAVNAQPDVRALGNLTSLAGRFSLDESTALLKACDLVITVDTGLMHVAAALGRPLVLLHGFPANFNPEHRNSLARFGPWKADYTLVAPTVLQRSARRIDQLTVEEVTAAVASRLP